MTRLNCPSPEFLTQEKGNEKQGLFRITGQRRVLESETHMRKNKINQSLDGIEVGEGTDL